LVPSGESATGDGEFAAFNTHLVSIDTTTATRLVKHTVRKGDTVASIARRYHVSAANLKEWNVGLNKLKLGQRVTIVQATPHGHKTRLAKAHKRGNTKLAQAKPQKLAHAKPQKQIAAKRPIKLARSH
jgi:LysM repeat protein